MSKLLQSNDDELIRRMRTGDINALHEIRDKYKKPMLVKAFIELNCEQNAMDAVQACFISFWNLRGKEREPGFNIAGYLFKALHYRIIDHVRRRIRERLAMKKYGSYLERLSGFIQPARRIDMMLDINKAIQSLTAQQQRVFVWRHFQGMEFKEISELLGIREDSVRHHLMEATKKLRVQLKHLK